MWQWLWCEGGESFSTIDGSYISHLSSSTGDIESAAVKGNRTNLRLD